MRDEDYAATLCLEGVNERDDLALFGRAQRRGRLVRDQPRISPALQLPQVFCAAIGRQMRRAGNGGLAIKSKVAVFG